MRTELSIVMILTLILTVPAILNATDITKGDKEGIELMREEEKLAHDVYAFLFEAWELPVFNNIVQAEARHFNAIGFLMDNFGLSDVALKEAGCFQNEKLQHLYDSLITKGNESIISALEVGAFIEEKDIQDLQYFKMNTSNETICNLYTNLLRASGNHLRAFTGQLKAYGSTYSPLLLDPKEYQKIMGTPHQKRGRMHRHRGGRD